MQKVAPTTTSEDAKELVRLCRTGRLYDVQKWIAKAKSLEVSALRKKTLPQIAVETGFHSLVELIAKDEGDQASKSAALSDAIALRRLDFVELLGENGAEITSVPFADVLLPWRQTGSILLCLKNQPPASVLDRKHELKLAVINRRFWLRS